MQRLRDRAARFEPVEGRGVDHGDTRRRRPRAHGPERARRTTAHRTSTWSWREGESARLRRATARPRDRGDQELHAPLSGRLRDRGAGRHRRSYTVTVKGLKRRGCRSSTTSSPRISASSNSSTALRARVRDDLAHEAGHAAEREVRAQLMKTLAARVPFELPPSLVERELDRRVEEFAHRLIDQKINPNEAGIDWRAFRESQRDVAREAVGCGARDRRGGAAGAPRGRPTKRWSGRSTRYAERIGRTAAAVRPRSRRKAGLSRVRASLRREKTIDFVLARATIAGDS